MSRHYWLFKSEPDDYSIDDLARDGQGRWDGVRNYQARNLLRDQVAQGDGVLFYHSSCKAIGIVGTARVVSSAYADPAQFDHKSPYFDAKATPNEPRWFCVDVAFEQRFPHRLSLARLKALPELADMVLLKQGRLSIQPVTADEWQTLLSLAQSMNDDSCNP